MWNIIFVIFVSIGATLNFENISTGWKIALLIISIFLETMILRKEYLQEQQEDRIKAIEKQLKELQEETK